MPIGSRDQAFFAAWTRKEAYIKAVGDGLHIPLDSFRVTLLPGEDARLVHIGGDAQAAGAWRMHAFHPAEGYLGALAYAGRRRNVRLFPAMEASAGCCEEAPIICGTTRPPEVMKVVTIPPPKPIMNIAAANAG